MRPEFQVIVDMASRLSGRPATLEDRDFNLVAFSSHDEHVDEVRLRSILQRHSSAEIRNWFEQFGITTSEAPVHTPASPELGIVARLCLPARWQGVTYGYLWLPDEQAIDPDQVPAAAELADRAGAVMARQVRSRDELEHTLRDLLSADPEAVDRAAAAVYELGVIDPDAPIAAVELRLVTPRQGQPAVMNVWRLPRTVLAISGEQHYTLLVPVGTAGLAFARDVAQQAWSLYADRLNPVAQAGLVAGIGDIRPNLTQARASWQEARQATDVAAVVPALRPIATWSDLGVYRLIACGPRNALAGAVLDGAVRRLLDHPDGDLKSTALAYLDAGGNVQQAANALNVHRQTVYYRVQKIEMITGLDLARGRDRLKLHLGLTMAPFIGRSDSDITHKTPSM